MPTIGVAPSKLHSNNCVKDALLLPVRLYKKVVYDRRPDVNTKKTREEEWKALQSQWRWAHAVVAYIGPPSNILWRIKWPLLCNMIIAGLALFDAFSPYQIFISSGLNSAVTLTWRLSSFMLALLMAFKVNRVYDRWWLGRQAFAGVGNACLGLSQQAVHWVKDPVLLEEILRWCKVWHFTIYQLLTREKELHPKAACLLDEAELTYYRQARKGRNLVTTRLRQLITRAGLDTAQFLQMDQAINKGISDQGQCTRILFQAMPYGLTLMCSGFLEIWLLIIPFGLFADDNSTLQTNLAPRGATGSAFEMGLYLLMCVLMLGVDEVTNQLEQPFPYMPLLDIADTTHRDVDRTKDEAETMARLGEYRLHVGAVPPQLSNEDGPAGSGPNGVGGTKQESGAVVVPIGP